MHKYTNRYFYIIITDIFSNYYRFCRHCLTSVIPGTKCPPCSMEQEIFLLQPTGFYPDPAMKKEINAQPANCDTPTCDWTGILKHYPEHVEKCEYRLVRCECDVTVAKQQLQQHRTSACTLRKVICTYCNANIVAREMARHLNTCAVYPVECPNKCGKMVKREDVESHVRSDGGDCENRPCPFGCEDRGADHAIKQAPAHLEILLTMIESLKQTAEINPPTNRQSETQQLRERIEKLENILEETKAKLDDPSILRPHTVRGQTTTTTTTTQQRSTHEHSDVAVAAGGFVHDTIPIGNPTINPESNTIQIIEEKQMIIEGLAAVLNREVEKLIHDQNNLEQQSTTNTDTLDQLQVSLASLERGSTLKDLAFAEHDLRIGELETSSFDGTMMIALKDISTRLQEAINGRTPSIYSTPFYTSRAGYKMCVRIYLNGDGMGKGTHISLFFVIMRGQYDAILPWPFKQKVTLMLLDQNNREHVIDAFRPDPSSSSFRRPQSAMNIASGVPLFCPLSKLEDPRYAYIKEDTMFFKVTVGLSGL